MVGSQACQVIDALESFQSCFRGDKNGERFDASLGDEEFDIGDEDGSCRGDHDEL